MAKFNPEVQAEGQNYLGYSRGQEVDDSLGILFKGAANVLEGAGTVADNNIQGRIREDITREYDATNDSFGVDAAAVVRGNTTGPGTSLPAEIEQSKNWFGKVSNAFLSGDLRESHYSARLEQRVKDLRARYPGYREQIDAIVADVTGMTPANVLRQQLFSEWESERKALLGSEDDIQKWADDAAKTGELDPALYTEFLNGRRDPTFIGEMKQNVAQNAYGRAETTAMTAQFALDKARGELRQDDVDNAMLRGTNDILNKVMKTGYNQFGFNFDEFEKFVTSAAEGGVTPEEIPLLTQGLAQAENAALSAVNEMLNRQWDENGGSFASDASKPAVDRAREEVKARFAGLRDMITNGETGLLKLDNAVMEASRNVEVRKLFETVPQMKVFEAVKGTAGAEVLNFLMMNEHGDALSQALKGYITGRLMTGTFDSTTDAFETLKKTGVKDPEVYRSVLEHQIEILKNDRSSLQNKEDAARNLFGEENNDFLLQIDQGQRLTAFNRLTSPEQTKAIVELSKSNPQVLKDYNRWAKDNFAILFSERSNNVHQAIQSLADRGASVVLDRDSGKLELEFEESDAEDATQGVDPLTGERVATSDPMRTMDREQAISGGISFELKEINAYLGNLKPITDASNEDFAVEVKSIFQAIDLEIDIDDGEDTSEDLIPAEDADLSGRDIMIDDLEDIAEVDLETPEEQQALFGEADDEDLAGYGGDDTLEASAQVLREFEGFRERPYWDVNAHRVGYGSDTITREDGSVVRVKKGMAVSREDAERDLKRRIGEFQNVARKQTGKASWDNLSSNVQAALTSVTYNYGRLPKVVVNAVRTGEPKKIASAILKLKNHNGGVNARRRTKEARIVLAGL